LADRDAVLLLSVEHGQDGADPMLARLAMTRALNAGRDAVLDDVATAPRRKAVKRYEVVR
jgi:hypothetical protein